MTGGSVSPHPIRRGGLSERQTVSHFYGRMKGCAKNEVTRRGHRTSGIHSELTTWHGGVKTILWQSWPAEIDYADIMVKRNGHYDLVMRINITNSDVEYVYGKKTKTRKVRDRGD